MSDHSEKINCLNSAIRDTVTRLQLLDFVLHKNREYSDVRVNNGAAAKSGLNDVILKSMWRMVVVLIRYKGLNKEKLTTKIPPQGTSQECCRCGHTHPDNRETQAEFICKNCGITANADYKAAVVIKKRAIKALLDGPIVVKQKKPVRVRKGSRPQIGQGLPKSKRASMGLEQYYGWPVCCRVGDYCKTNCGYFS